MNNVQGREQERAGTLLLGQAKAGWPVMGVSGRLRSAAPRAPWRTTFTCHIWGQPDWGSQGYCRQRCSWWRTRPPTDFDLVHFPSGDTSVASEGMANTEAPAPLCSKVIQELEFRGNCKAIEWELLPTRKEEQYFEATCGSSSSVSSTVSREVQEAGCAVIPFSSHSIYWDIKTDFVWA